MAGPFTNKDGEGYTRDVVWNGYDANLDPKVVEVLNRAQQLVDFPITLTSGYRSPERNKRAGGAKKSMHMQGLAADVSLRGLSDAQRTQLTRAFAQSGANRLIAYTGNTKMHLDMAGGYKPQKGYSVYAMFDRSKNNMHRAPAWYKAGLDGGKIPPGNIPDTASAYATTDPRSTGAPTPQLISAGLGNARNNPPPLPPRRPTTATPQTYDRAWMGDYGNIIGQHQPQRPTGQASLGPPQFTNWQDDYNSLIAKANPAVARAPMREPANPSRSASLSPQPQTGWMQDYNRVLSANQPSQRTAMREPYSGTNMRTVTIQPQLQRPPVTSVPQRTAASVPQRTIVATEPRPERLPGRPAMAVRPERLPGRPALPLPPAAPAPMSRNGAIRARANNPMAALPETEAERMFKQAQFRQMPPLPRRPPAMPAMPAPIPATMSAGLRQSRTPFPMPFGMRPQQRNPLAITVTGGNQMAPTPAPRLQRAPQPSPHYAAEIARNGYVYAPSRSGGAPVNVGSARPAGMTPSQQYDAANARSRASGAGANNVSGVSWWG